MRLSNEPFKVVVEMVLWIGHALLPANDDGGVNNLSGGD
jgi:hypothetical protein